MIEYNEGCHIYYVYITTNTCRSTFYIGVTNNLGRRLSEHQNNLDTDVKTFVSRYRLVHLIYYEKFSWIQFAIAREKELKGWLREKKLMLIKAFNHDMEFLEDRFIQKPSN